MHTYKIVAKLSLILSCTGLYANSTDSSYIDIDDTVESNLSENLDSLVNLWHVQQAFQLDTVEFNDSLVADMAIPNFSDSVYIDRLSRIPAAMDLTYNKIVKRYIEVYTKERREKVELMLGLADYYFPVFDDIFDYYGVPNELKYMSIIESALNPNAYSRAKAVGLWQFMYGTGKLYGLTINSLVDERRDPIKSTHAAARFSKDLYNMFGDWQLVIAAYNCGPGNVRKAMRRSGKTNYWDIYYYLPRETRGHVPAFIAATYVMNYYAEHNLKPGQIEMPLAKDTIMVTQKLHLKQVAEVLGIPLQQLKDMNPQYTHDIVPGNEKPYALTIPESAVGDYISLEDSIYQYKNSVFFSPANIQPMPTSNSYVPKAPGDNYAKVHYTVKPGDNLGFIADWYRVSLSDLRHWNNIHRNLIRSGQKLVIYVPKSRLASVEGINKMSFVEKQGLIGKDVASGEQNSAGVAPDALYGNNENTTYHLVKQGDTLWEIARKYPGVSELTIMKLNNLSYNDKIMPGQKLIIKK
ncbi:MAG: LysM peptidoglycan-binding domain-containing protein [Bacteroidales bacterium]|nr:LysM peptidoglycan-binding domain-containing protein [Bacteroidales bacterium]